MEKNKFWDIIDNPTLWEKLKGIVAEGGGRKVVEDALQVDSNLARGLVYTPDIARRVG